MCIWDQPGRIQRTVNVLSLVPVELAHCQLSVRGFRGTVSAWEIVDHDAQDTLTRHISNGGLESLDICDGVAISLASVCRWEVIDSLPFRCKIETHIQTNDPISATFVACSFMGLVMFAAAASISAR